MKRHLKPVPKEDSASIKSAREKTKNRLDLIFGKLDKGSQKLFKNLRRRSIRYFKSIKFLESIMKLAQKRSYIVM